VALVHQGPTLLPALDAHRNGDRPFEGTHLRPYLSATVPKGQQSAQRRHAIMRRARSPKKRPTLLAHLEARHLAPS
jgi:hypothetical protein